MQSTNYRAVLRAVLTAVLLRALRPPHTRACVPMLYLCDNCRLCDPRKPLRDAIDVLILWWNANLKGAPAPLILPTRAAVPVLECGHQGNIVLLTYMLNLSDEITCNGTPWVCSVFCWIPSSNSF